MPMDYRLQTAPAIEELSQELRLRVHHAAWVAEGEPGAHFHNRMPHARIFATVGCRGAEGGHCRIEERRLPLRPGSVVLVPPAQDLQLHFAPGLSLLAVHLDCRLGGGFDLLAGTSLQSVAMARSRLRSWRAALGDDADPLSAAMTLQAELLLVLAGMDLLSPQRLHMLRSAHRRYAPIITLIDQQPPAQVSVADCARAMGMGASTLSRAFRRDCGLTLQAFLQDRILDVALEALRAGHRSSRAISERIGFATEQAFSRFVRRLTGLSPGRYRRRMRGELLPGDHRG